MQPKLQRWVQRQGWDRASDSYERYWRRQLQPAIDGVLERAELQPGEDVVDVACGTGMVALPAAAAVGPTGRVLATDLSPRMIDTLRARAGDCRLANVEVAAVGAEQLDVVDEFDVALCSLGLMYVPSPADAVAAMRRALRPEGRIVVSTWGERRNCGWAELFPIVDARVSSDVCPMFFALGAPGALTELFEAAGFVDVEEGRLGVELRYDNADDALGAAFLGGPVALAYSRFDDDARAGAHREYLASISDFADGTGHRVPGEFVVCSARRVAPAPDPQQQPTTTGAAMHFERT
jgi:ubiquinone/menaquinone biosynthesis C-methylase UbiE